MSNLCAKANYIGIPHCKNPYQILRVITMKPERFKMLKGLDLILNRKDYKELEEIFDKLDLYHFRILRSCRSLSFRKKIAEILSK